MEPTWPPTERERDDAERRDAVFRLRLCTWLVRKHGRRPMVRSPRGRTSRLVVRCRQCRQLVMMPDHIGPQQLERMRLHLGLHTRALTTVPPSDANEILRHFHVKARAVP